MKKMIFVLIAAIMLAVGCGKEKQKIVNEIGNTGSAVLNETILYENIIHEDLITESWMSEEYKIELDYNSQQNVYFGN